MDNSKRKISSDNDTLNIVSIIVLVIWICLVIFVASKHEMWRDEVRVLSQVRQVSNPLDLYNVIQYDGHPMMWFLVVYFGSLFTNSSSVLAISAIFVSFVAVSLFLFIAPFQFWIKILFIFSILPLYEYTVMARGYGLGMMMIFIIAAIYKVKDEHPLVFSLLLFILANVTVQTAIITGFILFLWIYEHISERTKHKWYKYTYKDIYPFVIILAGILVCVAYTFPREISIVTSVRDTISYSRLWSALVDSVIHPERTFSTLIPLKIAGWVKAGLFFSLIAGLYKKPALLLIAIFALITFGAFFRLVYGPSTRHEGLLLIFVIALYWILMNQVINPQKSHLLMFSVYLILPIFLLIGIDNAKAAVLNDIKYARSASKELCEYLSLSPEYRNAILLPEPDYLLESIPYYCDNSIYFIREHRFGNTVSWTTDADTQLSLAELLAKGKSLKTHYDKPVFLVLGYNNIDFTSNGSLDNSYNKHFQWTEKDFEEFQKSTIVLKKFRAKLSDENFTVYIVR